MRIFEFDTNNPLLKNFLPWKQATINLARRMDQIIDQGLNLLDPLSNRYLALLTPNGIQVHMMVSDNSEKDRFPDGVRLSGGGEGRVEDIGNQQIIKRGERVDPNEVDMLNALRERGVNVPKVIDHGYVGDEYCIKMEKIIGRTLYDVLKDPSISKDFLLQVKKNIAEQYDKMGDLYHGDALAVENYIIRNNGEVYIIDVSWGGRQENKSKEEKREILEIIDFEANKRDCGRRFNYLSNQD
jgi:hypothetical protein